jgi:hypothetical protein
MLSMKKLSYEFFLHRQTLALRNFLEIKGCIFEGELFKPLDEGKRLFHSSLFRFVGTLNLQVPKSYSAFSRKFEVSPR